LRDSASPAELATHAKTVEASREPFSVLTINGGSSRVRFALYEAGEPLRRRLDGKVDRIGLSGTNLIFNDSTGESQDTRTIDLAKHSSVVTFLLDWLETQQVFASVSAVGHRVVHGMTHSEPERVTPQLLDELHRITPYDPEHLPLEIELIEAFRQRHPALPQVACFDTVFHRSMPRVASLLAIRRRYEGAGVRRYGFHGLSYEFLDPGLVSYLARTEQMSATHFQEMVNHESGLLGVSEISSDLRDLLALEADDVRAAEAVALFCYQTKKWIGSFAAALGGLDTLVFAGGIGENAPLIRTRICEGLNFLGVELNESSNAENADVISADASRVAVRVIRTDEEFMIARSVNRVLGFGAQNER